MHTVRPHWGWFLLAPAFVFAGVGVCIVLVIAVVGVSDDNRHRVGVPGDGVFQFTEAGSQSIFFEQSGTSSAQAPGGLVVHITPEQGGGSLAVNPPGGNFRYSSGGTAGVGIGSVEIPAPGHYRIRTESQAQPPMGAAVVVGRNPVPGILGAVFGSIAAIGAGFIAALVVVIVVAVKRSNYRRRMNLPQHVPGPYPPPPGARPSL